jgi:eukaryotic-like serine/threonine-protein kinase
MIGQRVHQYQITEKLGEGGMGVVYKAEDTRLQRTVALKFLHPLIVASADEQERLVHEARAAAGLAHPNICTIYEINEIDGSVFIAMQFIEGSTLRDRVLSGHIETDEALRFLIEIADGLKQAHLKGIVHRDMKSSNIMITPSGRAVIMDFGLARPVEAGRIDDRFSSRGTSAYMSPEQARGEAVDQRTDIWSLGVVLYEMLAGQLPFRGDYEQAVLYSILNEAPRPLAELRPAVPARVLKIVDRCLKKDPAERFQTLDELTLALRGAIHPGAVWNRGAPSRARVAGFAAAAVLTLVAALVAYDFIRGRQAGGQDRVPIAVIDFNNETDDASLDGLSGMLITALEQSRRLSVMTRSRMFDLLKTIDREGVERIDESLGQRICDAAGVDVLVIPTIRRFGDLYTIDLKVLDTRAHRYVFTTKEEGRGQESIPHMIDEIARDIRVDLRETLDAVARTASVAEVTTPDLAAYKAYFEGEEMLNRLDFNGARVSFQQAIEKDSTFALAYYRLAYTEWWARGRAVDARKHIAYAVDNLDRLPLKERFLVRALKAALDDGFEAQLPILTEMRALYPDDKEMLFGLGDAEFHSANFDSAAVHLQAALAIDPQMERALQHLTWTLMRLNRYEDGLAMARRWVATTGSAEALENQASAQIMLGDAPGALASLARAKERDPGDPKIATRLAVVRFAMGEPDHALRLLDEAEVEAADKEPLALVEISSMRAGVVYPYQGRYRDAVRIFDEGLGPAVRAYQDSSIVVRVLAAKSRLLYHGFGDEKTARDAVATFEHLSPRYRNREYWETLISLAVMEGDTTRVQQLSNAHREVIPAPWRDFYRVLALAVAGDCAGALDARSRLDAEALRIPDATDLLAIVLGHCLVEAGQGAVAIDQLRHVLDRPLLSVGIAPLYAPTWYDLGRAYEATGRTARALECYDRVLSMWKHADADLLLKRDVRSARDRLLQRPSM